MALASFAQADCGGGNQSRSGVARNVKLNVKEARCPVDSIETLSYHLVMIIGGK